MTSPVTICPSLSHESRKRERELPRTPATRHYETLTVTLDNWRERARERQSEVTLLVQVKSSLISEREDDDRLHLLKEVSDSKCSLNLISNPSHWIK